MRFDAVYHGHFKCNRWKLTEDPVLWAYARDLYQTPGFGDTVDFDHIKRHYYQVHTGINPTGIVPLGPDLSGWLTPHHREELGGRPFGDGTPPGPVPGRRGGARRRAGPDRDVHRRTRHATRERRRTTWPRRRSSPSPTSRSDSPSAGRAVRWPGWRSARPGRLIRHEDDAPDALDRDRGWGEVLLAAAVQGAIFAVVRSAVDRTGAKAIERSTGVWPAAEKGGRD